MADGVTAVRQRHVLDPRGWPWWLQVLMIYLASRVVSTAILLWFATHQGPNAWTGAAPAYQDFAMLWDAHWYRIIAAVGYPSELPITDTGHVGESAWAFMPLYPWLVEGIALVTWQPYEVVAIAVSVLAGLGAALLAHRMYLAAGLRHGQALGGVALLVFGPVSPLFQLGYAEALHLFLLTAALLLLLRRRYLALLPLVVLMAFTRPSALPFALALGILLVIRVVRARRGVEALPRSEVLAIVLAGAVSVVAGFAWLLIAWAVTGSPSAYLDTENAWRSAYLGPEPLLPLTGWLRGATWWAEWSGVPGWLGLLVLAAVVVLVTAAFATPWARRLGTVLRVWVAAWLLYLLAVFFPQSSTWRLLLPAYPAGAALAVGPRWVLCLALVGGVAAQWWWVDGMWAVSGYDWSPP